MNKFKKNDKIIVISGKDRGRTGTIRSVSELKDRVTLKDLNLVKKNIKANPNKQVEGGIVKIEAAIHISNIAIYNEPEKKSDRIGFKFIKNSREKKRYFKSNDKYIIF
jgi:large subunit ribosomal protein L24